MANITSAQVKEAIDQLAAMTAAASITPEAVASVMEKLRNLTDAERQEVVEVASAYLAEINTKSQEWLDKLLNTGGSASKVMTADGSNVQEALDLIRQITNALSSQFLIAEYDNAIYAIIDKIGRITDKIDKEGCGHHYCNQTFYGNVEVKGKLYSKSIEDSIASKVEKAMESFNKLGIYFDAENNTLTLQGKSYILIENADIPNYSEYLLQRYSFNSERYVYAITDANNKILYSESVSGEIFKPRIDDEEIADVVDYYITHRGVEA